MRAVSVSSFVAGLLLTAGLLSVPGCASDGGDDGDYPIVPGSSGDPGSHDPSPGLSGRVCLVSDLRDLGTCGMSGAGGLIVSGGGASAITGPDGGFDLRPLGEIDELMVSGPGVFPTFNPFDPSGLPVVRAIDADVYARELSTTGVLLPDNTGSILGSVTASGEPARGIGVTSVPSAPFGPYYDGTGAFTTDRTGARGIFFVPGLSPGAASLTFRDLATGGETLVNGVTVRNGGITILDSVALP